MKNRIIKQILWFLGITFSITYGLAILTYILGGLDKFPLTILSMPIPMLAAFFVQKVIVKKNIFKGGELGIRIGVKKFWFIYPVIFMVILTFIYFISFLISPSLLLNELEFLDNTQRIVVSNNLSFLLSSSSLIQVLSIFILNVIIGPFLNIWLFLGEEIGWRSFLTPRLVKVFGKRGLIIGGTIWGLWHGPAILMGLNYPENPILGNILFILVAISVGIIFQYFYLRSKTVFVVAFCHGILNQFVNTVMMLFVAENTLNFTIYGATGIIGIIIFSIISIYFYQKVDWEKNINNNHTTIKP